MVDKNTVEAACVPCTRDHLITVKALLSEAARMAKNRQISDPEIQKRIASAEEELDAWERFDVAPEQIATLPAQERVLIRDIVNKARSGVRHQLESTGLRWGKGDVKDLEDVSKTADELMKEFREKVSPVYGSRRFGDKDIVSSSTNGTSNYILPIVIIGAIIAVPVVIYLLKRQ